MPTNIRAVERLAPDGHDRSMLGVVVKDAAGQYAVNVQGNTLVAQWQDPTYVNEGDTVMVQLVIGRTGTTEALVRGRVSTRTRPERGTVTVVPPSSDTVSVLGSDGNTYTAYFLSGYTPVVNDKVILNWTGVRPVIMGKVPVVVTVNPDVPPPPPAPPAAVPQTGISTFTASDSATIWGPGGWNSWAGGRGRVFQGQYGSGQVFGSWFYHGSPAALAGYTITRFRIILGGRIPAGAYNSPVTVHFYAHNSTHRPGQFTDVSRVVGPFDVTANPGQGLTEYDLPGNIAAQVIAGGGISIALDPYAGFYGRQEQPESGKLIFDWSK